MEKLELFVEYRHTRRINSVTLKSETWGLGLIPCPKSQAPELRGKMPIYPFKCDDCGKTTEVQCSIADYETVRVNSFCAYCKNTNIKRIYTPVNVICHWGTGYVGGDRIGYIPGVDNPAREIKADMKALEEKQTHEDNPAKRKDLTLALSRFAEAHEDVLK